jgi:hypothetical protein
VLGTVPAGTAVVVAVPGAVVVGTASGAVVVGATARVRWSTSLAPGLPARPAGPLR